MNQIIVGVDTHKSNHVAVAINAQGARLGSLTIPTTSPGGSSRPVLCLMILSVVFGILVFRVLKLGRTTIKTGNHHLQQEMRRFLLSSLRRERCQIKSELVHFRPLMSAGDRIGLRPLRTEKVRVDVDAYQSALEPRSANLGLTLSFQASDVTRFTKAWFSAHQYGMYLHIRKDSDHH